MTKQQTPNYKLPYYQESDPPDGAAQQQALADRLEALFSVTKTVAFTAAAQWNTLGPLTQITQTFPGMIHGNITVEPTSSRSENTDHILGSIPTTDAPAVNMEFPAMINISGGRQYAALGKVAPSGEIRCYVGVNPDGNNWPGPGSQWHVVFDYYKPNAITLWTTP